MSEHRPFPPSPRRLALARRAGVHGASPRITTAVASIAFLVAAIGLGRAIATRLGESVIGACTAAAAPASASAPAPAPTSTPASGLAALGPAALADHAAHIAPAILALALPLLVAAALAALVAHLAQTRALWLPRRKLDGAPQLPRDRDLRGAAFTTIVGATAFGWLWFAAPRLAALVGTPLAAGGALIASAAGAVVVAIVAIAAADALVRRFAYHRGLAMTHAEQRADERLATADPRWRRLRERLARRDARPRRPSDDHDHTAATVAQAAVLLLGDGIAVAIAWDPAREPVPHRTATGATVLATQLVGLARRYRVPIHREPTLATALAGATGPVPEAYWPRLAEIVAATRRS